MSDEKETIKKTEEVTKETMRESLESDEVLGKAHLILDQYGGIEGNIPVSSDYWNLMNRFRGLRAENR